MRTHSLTPIGSRIERCVQCREESGAIGFEWENSHFSLDIPKI